MRCLEARGAKVGEEVLADEGLPVDAAEAMAEMERRRVEEGE